MANATDQNPWIIDTAGATVLTADRVRCNLRWVGATTAGHGCIIKNAAGKTVWESVAAGANNVESDQLNGGGGPFNFDGIAVTTLASGRLYIEFV